MTIVINGMKITEATTFQYKSNPKRAGSKAYGRYSVYEAATNLAEYNSLCEDFSKYAKADLRYDTEKGHLTLFGEDDVAMTPSTSEILSIPAAAAIVNAKKLIDENEAIIEAAEAEIKAEEDAAEEDVNEDAPTEAEEAEMDALDAEEQAAEEAEAEAADADADSDSDIFMDDDEEAEAAELEEAERLEDETL